MRLFEEVLSDWLRARLEVVLPGSPVPLAKMAVVVPSGNDAFGDYQCNGAMGAAKAMKRNPREVASLILDGQVLPACVEKAEVAGAGFINFYLKNEALAAAVEEIARDPFFGVPRVGADKTVVLDYSSPNVAKPMHIGHIRSTVIGHALDRLHRFLGYRVLADNHLGDWGTQFGIIIMGFRHYVDQTALRETPVEELERIYVRSYEQSKADPGWLAAAKQELVKLQNGDADNLALWKQFIALSMAEFERLYKRLGVQFDLVRGESFYRDQLAGLVERLTVQGLAVESEGARVVFLEDEKLPPCLVRKSDGGFNYATTDIATVLNRVEEFKPDRIVYVTDERQQLHFRQFFAVARRLGVKTELVHVWFGLMRLPEGTFSTRQGNVIKLERLLDEAEQRALALVQSASPDMLPETQRDVARAVGIGAVRYADLSQNPQTLITFTWDKALALNGNSAPYLQYACARIASVRDKYKERFPGGDFDKAPIRVEEAAGRALALRLARFPEAAVRATETYRPNVLADYLYDLSQAYSSYYQNVPFLQAPEGVRESRIRLSAVTERVLRRGLNLLGIETPDRI
ncbi:MAG: arginine--tRNA ligase [Kiritimatiellia bacterium]